MDTRIENLFMNSKIVRRVEKCLLTHKRVTNSEKFAYLETVHELRNNGFGLFQIHEHYLNMCYYRKVYGSTWQSTSMGQVNGQPAKSTNKTGSELLFGFLNVQQASFPLSLF